MTIPQIITYVGFWKRVGAKLIDIVLLGSITYFTNRGSAGVGGSGGDYLAELSAYISLASLYYMISWGVFGGTIGNYCLGQRVINERQENPTPKQIVIRVIVVLLSECFLSLPFITIALDSKKQGLHDKIAGTYVVEHV